MPKVKRNRAAVAVAIVAGTMFLPRRSAVEREDGGLLAVDEQESKNGDGFTGTIQSFKNTNGCCER